MSVFLSSEYTYSPTHLHKEKIKTCQVSGKFLNIYINFLWRNPKWVWTISKNSNTTASNCWKLIILPCWKQASKYPDMKFCSTIFCTELVSILLKTQGSFLPCHFLFEFKTRNAKFCNHVWHKLKKCCN